MYIGSSSLGQHFNFINCSQPNKKTTSSIHKINVMSPYGMEQLNYVHCNNVDTIHWFELNRISSRKKKRKSETPHNHNLMLASLGS